MKLDMFKVLGIIVKGMSIAQAIGEGKTGKEKLDIAVNESTDILQLVEGVSNKDLLKDERLKPFVEKYVAASKDLVNKAHELEAEAKDLKA